MDAFKHGMADFRTWDLTISAIGRNLHPYNLIRAGLIESCLYLCPNKWIWSIINILTIQNKQNCKHLKKAKLHGKINENVKSSSKLLNIYLNSALNMFKIWKKNVNDMINDIEINKRCQISSINSIQFNQIQKNQIALELLEEFNYTQPNLIEQSVNDKLIMTSYLNASETIKHEIHSKIDNMSDDESNDYGSDDETNDYGSDDESNDNGSDDETNDYGSDDESNDYGSDDETRSNLDDSDYSDNETRSNQHDSDSY